jgi:hypothetical protein
VAVMMALRWDAAGKVAVIVSALTVVVTVVV